MIETLYKTPTPEKDKSECYVFVLASRASSGGKEYAFMAEHGQWNDDLQRFVYKVDAVHAEEGLTYQNAWGMYETAKRNLATKGFIHSLIRHEMRKEPRRHERPRVELATA